MWFGKHKQELKDLIGKVELMREQEYVRGRQINRIESRIDEQGNAIEELRDDAMKQVRLLRDNTTDAMLMANQKHDADAKALGKAVNQRLDQFAPSKTCEVCGCLVDAKFAIAGKDEVRTVFKNEYSGIPLFGYDVKRTVTKTIHTPYYCRIHAPKVDQSKGGKAK